MVSRVIFVSPASRRSLGRHAELLEERSVSKQSSQIPRVPATFEPTCQEGYSSEGLTTGPATDAV